MMVYVSNAESHEISVLDLNGQDGRSRLIETVATRGSVMSLAIDPGRKCLYAALRSKPHSLSSWAIHPDTGTPSFAVLVAVRSFGFEGPDYRWIAVTGRL